MNKKQIRAVEILRTAADNARKAGLTEKQVDIVMKPDVSIDQILRARA